MCRSARKRKAKQLRVAQAREPTGHAVWVQSAFLGELEITPDMMVTRLHEVHGCTAVLQGAWLYSCTVLQRRACYHALLVRSWATIRTMHGATECEARAAIAHHTYDTGAITYNP